MTQDRIRRLLRLVTLMQSGRRCNVRSMCTSLEVSRRTLFRDLSVLQDAGIQYVYDGKEKTYTMESSVLLQPVNLTVAETLAVLGLIRKLLPEQMLPDFHAHSLYDLLHTSSQLGRVEGCALCCFEACQKHWGFNFCFEGLAIKQLGIESPFLQISLSLSCLGSS